MLEFRKQPAAQTRRTASMDGFSRPSRAGALPRVDNFRARTSSVGNFRQADGFSGAKSAPMLDNMARPRHATSQQRHSRTAHTMQSVMEQHTQEDSPAPRSPKRSGTPKKRRLKLSPKKVIKRSMAFLLVCLVLGGSYFGVKAWIVNKNIFAGGGNALALNKNIDPSRLNGEGDGRINIMMLGKGGEGHPGGELTDTLLIASIDPINNEAALLSIPRDLWVKVAGSGSMKINSVFNTYRQEALADGKSNSDATTAGFVGLEGIVEQSIGIQIHYYVSVDFDAYKEVVDSVGGITITLENAIYDPNFDWEYGRNALKLPAGQVELSGTQALLLGRSRGAAGGYGVASDFDRNENQRKMIIALKDKIMSAGTYGNPVKINELLTAFQDNVRTNFNGASDLLRLYNLIKDMPSSSIKSLSLVEEGEMLVTTSTIAGQSVVVPRAGVTDFSAIQAYVRQQLVDGFIKNEAATIAVYNGSGITGLGAKRADELKSYGYNVTLIESAPTSDYVETVIIDRTNGAKKYTKRYLEKRYSVTATTEVPTDFSANTNDFVIIIGSNEKTSRQTEAR